MNADILEALERLNGLRKRGVISDDEYEAEKRGILAAESVGARKKRKSTKSKRPARSVPPSNRLRPWLALLALATVMAAVKTLHSSPTTARTGSSSSISARNTDKSDADRAADIDQRAAGGGATCAANVTTVGTYDCFQRAAELSIGEVGYQAALRGENASSIERKIRKEMAMAQDEALAARERINETCANQPGAQGTADSLSVNYSAIGDEVRRHGRFDFDRVLELCAVSATRKLGSLPEMLREINLTDR